MPRNGLPYFPLDVDDYLEDEAVILMSAEAEGCYIRLLCRSWKSKTPGVIKAALVGELCGLHRIAEPARERVLGELARAFVVTDESWTQRRMVAEWRRAHTLYESRKRGARNTNSRNDVTRSPHAERTLSAPLSARSPRVGVGVGVENLSQNTSAGAPENPAAPPPLISLPLRDGTAFHVTPAMVATWDRVFPDVAVMQTLREMFSWLEANPSRRKTRAGAKRFVTAWLLREQNNPPRFQKGH